MYKSFRVKNFRCFKDLQINDLGRVNLIAGKNNTGKTALMEAMYIFTRPKSPKVIIDLQSVRGLSEPKVNRRGYWKQLFYDMDSTQSIGIDMADSGSEIISGLIISELPVERTSSRMFHAYGRFIQQELSIGPDESHKYKERIDAILEFSVSAPGHTLSPAFLPSNPELPTRSFREADENSEFVPVQGREDRATALKKFSQLDKEGEATQLIHLLQRLDPRLSDLRLSMPDGDMDLWARVNGALLPIKVMGEGVNRICHILLTMLSGVDYLFIDEIENGIHHSVHKDIWQAIGQAARELDVQVFATTHSLEMIEAAHEAFKNDDPYEFRYHRLDRKSDGDIEAVTYNKFGMDAVAAFDFEHEVRG